MTVMLKHFDTAFMAADALLGRFEHRLKIESTNPSVWTKAQVEDLTLLKNSLSKLWDAVSEIANQVRDD